MQNLFLNILRFKVPLRSSVKSEDFSDEAAFQGICL